MMKFFFYFLIYFYLFCLSSEQTCLAASSLLHKTPNPHYTKHLPYKLIPSNKNSPKKEKIHHSYTMKNKKKALLLAANETGVSAPWSNAFNFKKVWGTQVDSRTGRLSAFVKAGSMISNLGHGPDINLEVNYNSGSIANSDAIAMGWSWNLSHFNTVTNELTTSFGQSFHLMQNSNGTWQPLYHKLKDILIQGNKNTHFIITYANGLRETLNNKGYEIRLEQQDGGGVNFLYLPGTNLLRAVKDDQGHKITIIYRNSYITVISSGIDGQPISIRINNANDQLSDITLPLKTNDLATTAIHISYNANRITQINYPPGLKKTFYYNCNSAIKLPLTNDAPARALCAISKRIISISKQQHDSVTRYEYAIANANEHNYLGFNSGLTLVNGSVRDILFEAPVDYTYRTIEDNGISKEIRSYNKYHLLIDDKKISDRTEHILSEMQNFYCRTDELNGCARTSFKNLPVTYSLPLKMVTKIWGTASGKPDISTVRQNYDDQGRIINNLDSYGRITKTTYCPIQGDVFCPAAPKDWPYNALPEKTTIYPATITTDVIPVAPLNTYNYYHKEFNRTDHGYILVLDHQTQQSGDKKTTITRNYYNDSSNALTYGLIRKTTMTGTVHGALNSISKDYHYAESPDGHSKTIYKSIELNQHKSLPLSTVTTSIFTNQLLQQTDATGKNINQYHYDIWGRMIQIDLSVGTVFASHTYYQYQLSPLLNEVLITTSSGLQHKVIMDNAGRQIMDFDEAISADGKAMPWQWLLKHKTTYNQYGQIVAKYNYLADSSYKVHPIITTYYYDDMGAVTKMHLSDDETVINLYDDPLHCTVSYRKNLEGQRSAISVMISNMLGKPIQQIMLPATQTPLPSTATLCKTGNTQADAKISTTIYDGFGRVVTVTDTMGRVTHKAYDALGQVTNITNPVGDKIHLVYNLANQVIQTWSLPHSGGKYLLSSAQYNTDGQRLWQAGEDGKHTAYTYTPDGKPQTITTPRGDIISFQYNVLGLPIAKYVNGKLQLKLYYAPTTALLVKKTDNTGVTTWIYSDDHLTQQEIHTRSNGYSDYRLQWWYDQNRRIISTTDIHAHKTFTQYDALGRVATLHYQNNLLFTQVYDSFSRIVAIRYGSGMQRIINYGSYGRLHDVKDVLNSQLLSKKKYTYDANDNIIQIDQQADNNKIGVLHYRYDKLNNLVFMSCNGSSGLPLCPRDTAFAGSDLKKAPVIIQQDYRFTPLNRIAQVKEVLQTADNQKTLSKVMNYDYSDAKVPLRLQSISTLWNNSPSITSHFSYDATGNMIVDGEGNQMTFNPFNQVISVIKSNGKQSFYSYDGSGKEVMEKTPDNTDYLFYLGSALINESINSAGQTTHTIGYYGVARTIDGVLDQYYEHNYKGDVTGIFTQDSQNHSRYQLNRRNIYSPYGMSWHNPLPSLHLQYYQEPLFGFDNERTDPATGWQFLGAGHRTYNPPQRYFISEDPAGNGYSFGSNNPIMNTDPSGNMPKWLGAVMNISADAFTLGLASVHKKWANIAGAVVMVGLMIVGPTVVIKQFGNFLLTITEETAGVDLIVGGAIMTSAIFTAVPVVSAIIPSNKGLNIAAQVTGIMTIIPAVIIETPVVISTISSVVRSVASLGKSIAGSISRFLFTDGGTRLADDLLASNPELSIKRSASSLFFRKKYLIINNDEQLGEALYALQKVTTTDDSSNAFVIASTEAGKTIDLQKIDRYSSTLTALYNNADADSAATLAAEKERLFLQINSGIMKNYSGKVTDEFLSRGNVRGLIISQNDATKNFVLSIHNTGLWEKISFNGALGTITRSTESKHDIPFISYTPF